MNTSADWPIGLVFGRRCRTVRSMCIRVRESRGNTKGHEGSCSIIRFTSTHKHVNLIASWNQWSSPCGQYCIYMCDSPRTASSHIRRDLSIISMATKEWEDTLTSEGHLVHQIINNRQIHYLSWIQLIIAKKLFLPTDNRDYYLINIIH